MHDYSAILGATGEVHHTKMRKLPLIRTPDHNRSISKEVWALTKASISSRTV